MRMVWTTAALAAIAALCSIGDAKATAVAVAPRVEDITVPLTRVAFGSCNDQSLPQPLWPTIASHEPDMWIWMGDNIYADWRERDTPLWPPRRLFIEATEDELRRRYARQLRNPDYSAFVSKTPMIGIWDDHDFGINDGHKGYMYRKESQQAFLDFFNEPADSPRRKQEGVYASYVVGSGEKTVKFILIDNRYHRDSYLMNGGDFLGEAQWTWLERELTNSTAAFNVIVSGIQILPADRFFNAERWSFFPPQRERLLKLILGSNAKGVILLSGDVHYSEINQVICSNGQNVLTEMTSSGLTHTWLQFQVPEIGLWPALQFTFASLLLTWEFRPHADSYYPLLNWGLLEIDWDSQPHPVASVQVRGEDDKIKLQFTVSSTATNSSSPGEDAVSCKAPRAVSAYKKYFWETTLMVSLLVMIASFVFNVYLLLRAARFVLTKMFSTRPTSGKTDSKKTV